MYLNKHELIPMVVFLGLDFNGGMFTIKIYNNDSVSFEKISV